MSELTELLITPAPQLERVMLAIARDAHPRLDDRRVFHELDRLAEPLVAQRLSMRSLPDRVSALVDYVYDGLGFGGVSDDHGDPRNCYLNDVLDRRCGVAVSLAIVLWALGSRAGMRVAPVGFPGRFLVRVGGPGGAYLDPLERARSLDRRGLEQLHHRLHGQRRIAGQHLRPASARDIALETLLELKRVYQRRRDHAHAMVVCDRLVDVTNAPSHRRDRGMHAFVLGAYAAAVDDLVSYLTDEPEAPDAAQVRTLLDRALARAGKPS